MEKMKIKNNRASLVWLPAVAPYAKLRLMPGVNLVDPDNMIALDGNEGVAALFDQDHGILEMVEEGEPLIPDNPKETLAGGSVKTALALIASCSDEGQLNTWAAADSRSTVHKAIFKRISDLPKREEVFGD